MVQSELVERFDTAVVPLMTETEARECITRINTALSTARKDLNRLYEGRGWEALGYVSWRECATTEFPQFSERYLYLELKAGQIEQNISGFLNHGSKDPIPERQLRPLAALTPMEQPIAWQEANERSGGKPTARVVEDVVKEMLKGSADEGEENDVLDPPMEPAQAVDLRKPRVNAGLFTSATPEWYTPTHIVERVESVFGQIDLDPCSNSSDPAQANVPALSYWTQADDGIKQPWHGKIYMNPPYGDEIATWVARMINAYEDDEIYEAIALLPARTDTAWFQPLFAYTICFVRGRLKFSGSENSAPFPSAVVYLGKDQDLFFDWFHTLGETVKRIAE